ncbi:hypothetical protein EC968_006415 [Mortierella alpina]|nr:hypothetical protein EC968_006415 [Mortierella alpina]
MSNPRYPAGNYHNTKSDGTYYYKNSSNPDSYYYSNSNGSYYYQNADGSKYYSNPNTGTSRYTTPSGYEINTKNGRNFQK